MRNLASLMLACLLAVTLASQPASALCLVQEEDGGCAGIAAPTVAFDVRSDCDDAAAGLCLADDGNASNILAGNDLHLNVTNRHGSALDFEVFVIQPVDDAVDDSGEPLRLRVDRIALIEDVAAGETRYAKIAVDGNTSMLRFQAVSADGKHAELDVQAMHVMYMTGGAPEVDPAQDGMDDATDDLAPQKGRKDAPYIGLVAIVGVLAAIVGMRRHDET